MQTTTSDFNATFRSLTEEIGMEVKNRNSAVQQLEQDIRERMEDLQDATYEISAKLQKKVGEMEEILPLEIKARQKGDDRLKKRFENTLKSLTLVIETMRQDAENSVANTISHMNSIVQAQNNILVQVETKQHDVEKIFELKVIDYHAVISNAMKAASTEEQLRYYSI